VRRSLALLLAAAALAAAAGGLPAPALLVPAVGLVIVTAAAWATVTLALRRVSVWRGVPTPEAIEDSPVGVRFDVDGLGRLPVRLEARLVGDAWLPLAAGVVAVPLTVGNRGSHWLRPSALRLRDAFGIAERRLHVGRSELLLALPRPDAGALGPEILTSSTDDVDLDGLVPYTPGTPIGRIHWPTLARGAGLHARRIAPAAGAIPLVIVETGGGPAPEAVDWAARVAAGVILGLARTSGCLVLLPGDRVATTVTGTGDQWHRMHRRLALLEPSSRGAGRPPSAGREAGVVRIDATRAPAVAARPWPAAEAEPTT
jgi:uncharacterized protein (DUF58 family)